MSHIDEITARLAAATPGPWRWGGNVKGELRLEGAVPPHVFVLSPPRIGFGYACWRVQPREAHRNERGWGPMVPLREYAVPEVPYRDDIDHIEHPDAELIANAPADIEFLLGEVRRLRAELDMANDQVDEVVHDFAFGLLGAEDDAVGDREGEAV